MTWATGAVFEGSFKHGAMHGKAKMIYSDKKEYEGDWVENKCEGEGVMRWPD